MRSWMISILHKPRLLFYRGVQLELAIFGTKKVKTGSHKEKIGTRKVANPDRKSGFLGFFSNLFKPKYIDENVYETVDDYKDEDVYKTVLEYKTIMRDVFEERTEQIEKFSVSTILIQKALIAKMRRNLDEGTESALGFASEQVERTKAQFSHIFAELDDIISAKYNELEQCATDQTEKEAKLKENQKVLSWIESCMSEINTILDL